MISLVLSNGENTEENKYSPEKKKVDVFTGWCIHLYNYDAEFIPMNSLTYLRTSIHISTSLKYIKDVLTSLKTHLTLSQREREREKESERERERARERERES